MKWIYWLLIAVIIIGLSQDASAGHRKKRSGRYRHRHRNLLKGGKQRIIPKRNYYDYYDNSSNEDDYYDALHLGRQNTPEKTEIIEEENSESNANQNSTIPSNSKFDGINGADSERSGIGANNPVFTAFLTKKQDILNAFTSSTSTSTTTTTTSTTLGPITITAPITATITAVPADQAPVSRDESGPTGDDTIVQRVQQRPVRQKQVLVQYRPIVIRQQVNRRRQPGINVNRLQPLLIPGNLGGFGGSLGQMIRVPVRLAKKKKNIDDM